MKTKRPKTISSGTCSSGTFWNTGWWTWMLIVILCTAAIDGYGHVATIDREISGKVTNQQGESLSGVNVMVKGTTMGTSTSNDGSYNIVVPNDQAILVFSYVGYATEEAEVGNRAVINVSLRTATALDEVVVVGYGSESVKKLATSVSTVKAYPPDQVHVF